MNSNARSALEVILQLLIDQERALKSMDAQLQVLHGQDQLARASQSIMASRDYIEAKVRAILRDV